MTKQRIELFSIEPEKYGNTSVEVKVVNNIRAYVEKRMQKNEIVTAKKTAVVTARKGAVGETADTRPRVERDGKIYTFSETQGKVKVEGSMIICNPDGEEYIVKPDKFADKYESAGKKGQYYPKGDACECMILDEDIMFMAPWGEPIYALKGSVLNITNLNDIYSITNVAFEKTYEVQPLTVG